ncbi:hypothetical protein ABGV42_04955 [Paenibacillus pabuli]
MASMEREDYHKLFDAVASGYVAGQEHCSIQSRYYSVLYSE